MYIDSTVSDLGVRTLKLEIVQDILVLNTCAKFHMNLSKIEACRVMIMTSKC